MQGLELGASSRSWPLRLSTSSSFVTSAFGVRCAWLARGWLVAPTRDWSTLHAVDFQGSCAQAQGPCCFFEAPESDTGAGGDVDAGTSIPGVQSRFQLDASSAPAWTRHAGRSRHDKTQNHHTHTHTHTRTRSRAHTMHVEQGSHGGMPEDGQSGWKSSSNEWFKNWVMSRSPSAEC